MKQYILLIFTLLYSLQSFAQIVKVIDKETKAPLSLVSIVSDDQNYLITNSSGIVNLEPLSNSQSFTFSLIGYEMRTITYSNLHKINFIIKLQPKDYLLNQVVISALRWSSETAQLPSKIIGIKKSQIEMQNPQTAADLLNTTGEVFIQKSQMGGGSPMIRGFSANRLLLSVDGVRMNTAIFRGGNLQNIISIDPFSVSNTEVLFGPGSVIYGSDAIGGVMSFFTTQPQFSDSSETKVKGGLDIRYASANREKTGHFDINIGRRKWALYTSFSNFVYDDLEMGKYGPDSYLSDFYVKRFKDRDSMLINQSPRKQKPTDYSQFNFMQKLRYKPNNNWDLNYNFQYSRTSDVPRYDRLMQTKNDVPKYAEWNYGPQIWMMNLLTIDHFTETKAYDKFSIKAAYQHFEESRIDRGFNENIRRQRTEKVEAFSVNADFLKEIRQNDQLLYGFEGIYNDVTSVGQLEDIITKNIEDGPSRYPKSNWASYAAYVNYNLHLNDHLLLSGGLRYNRYILNATFDTTFYPLPYTTSNINKGALVGNLGLNYQPGNNWVLSMNLSTGFRSPNVDDMGKIFDSEPGAVIVPNPNLEAEYIYNAELGISKGISEKVSVNGRVFYSILENAMVRRDYSINGQDSMMYDGEMSKIQAIQNASYSEVWGISLGLEAKIFRSFQFSSRFNYQKGFDAMEDGSTSPTRHAAPMFGLSKLSYNHRKWQMELYAQYSGAISYENLAIDEKGKSYLYAVDENGNPFSPAWYTINYKLRYQLHTMLHLSLGLENITNQRYRTYSSGIAASGTNLIFALNFRF